MDIPETTEQEPAATSADVTGERPAFATGGPVVTGTPTVLGDESIEPAPQPEAAAAPALPPGRYRFVYGDTTVYPAHGITAEPGSEHDWPDGPPTDGRWTPVTEGA